MSSGLANFIAGAPLLALNKDGGGLRPIAIGEAIRRLISKCCVLASEADAKELFGSLQVGVAMPSAAEAAVHVVRHLAETLGNDPQRIMLKVDFRNAFNLVDRSALLQQALNHFPGMYSCFSLWFSKRSSGGFPATGPEHLVP